MPSNGRDESSDLLEDDSGDFLQVGARKSGELLSVYISFSLSIRIRSCGWIDCLSPFE